MHENERLRAALAYASIGWHVFPAWWVEDGKCACGNADCKSPGKHPISKAAPWGQTSATVDAATIKTWWENWPKANIAVFLERSGLCAIDIDPRNGGLETIDQIEAQHGPLESDLLQFTGGGGEHRVFQLPGNGMTLPGKLGPGVDVKLNGYIMLEPSNHASGKEYAWEASSDPRDGLMATPLPDWLRDLAFRRVAEPPIAGPSADRVLMISDSQRAELLQALGAIPSDDRETWLHVGMALKSTHDHQWAFGAWDQWSRKSSKYDPVDQMRVWRSIKATGLEKLTYRTIFELSKRHGLVVRPSVPKEIIDTSALMATVRVATKVQEYTDPLPFPAHLLKAPGVIGTTMQWMLSCANKPQPVLALAATLTLLGTALAQKVRTQTGFRTNIYAVGVGGTSAGKDHARKCNKLAMSLAGLDVLMGGEELASSQGLLGRVAKHPVTLFQIDEFGLFLQAVTSQKSGSHLKQITTVLMKLFTSAGVVYNGTEYADQDGRPRVDIEYPCVNLHATTTPETLFDAFTGADVTSGNLNRMLFFFAPERKDNWPMRFVEMEAAPESLVQWLKAARTLSGPGMQGATPADPVKVMMNEAAQEQFVKLYEHQQNRERETKSEGTDGLLGRLWEHAAKLSLIAACARHEDASQFSSAAEHGQIVINEHDASWGIELATYLVERMVFEVAGRVADSDFGRDKQTVLGFIEKAGSNGLTERELSRACRKFSGMNPMQRQAIVSALVSEEAIGRVDFAPISGRGRHRVAMVSTAYQLPEKEVIDHAD